ADAALGHLPAHIHLYAQLQWRQAGRALFGQPLGDFQPVDAMHPGKVRGNQACLVTLNRTYEMPFQCAIAQLLDLVDTLLSIILPEGGLATVSCSTNRCGRESLRDR